MVRQIHKKLDSSLVLRNFVGGGKAARRQQRSVHSGNKLKGLEKTSFFQGGQRPFSDLKAIRSQNRVLLFTSAFPDLLNHERPLQPSSRTLVLLLTSSTISLNRKQRTVLLELQFGCKNSQNLLKFCAFPHFRIQEDFDFFTISVRLRLTQGSSQII